LKREPGQETYKLFVNEAPQAQERVLVDPDTFAKDGNTYSIDYYEPSPDGRLVAYGLSPNGSEMAVIHVVETASGRELPDIIDRARWAFVSWQPDSHSFFYKRDRKQPADASESERFSRPAVHLHVLGKAPDDDPAVFGHGVSPNVTVPDEAMVAVYSALGSSYLFAIVMAGVRHEDTIYYARRSALAGSKTPWKKLADAGDEISSIEVHGDDVYLKCHHGAPRSKVLKVNLSQLNLANAAIVVPESQAVITKISAAKDALYVQLLDAGIGRISRIPHGGGKATPVSLPVEGTVRDLATEPDEPGALFRLTSWTVSPKLFSYDPSTAKVTDTRAVGASPIDYAGITSSEVRVKSADGTLVPLSIVHRRDLALDGTHATLLEVYGSYGVVAEPKFDPMVLAWLERGTVHAVCHPRGGGEYGEGWHEAGKLAYKVNTIADLIACAQYLVEQKFTSPARLAVDGMSAGGIAVGGAVARRPELFGAAVIRVGMTNALRFEQIPIGPANTSEFGTTKTEEGFKMLWAIDAYHQIKPGTPYPAVLLTTGVTDPRVSPWQAAKTAARLQVSTSSGKPVLLRVDYRAGHGTGSAKSRAEAERADKYGFLLWQLGAAN
jgi:prolyl oligopeptidase